MLQWFYYTTLVNCPGPLQAPEPGPVGPGWTLMHLVPLPGSLVTNEPAEPGSILALATWAQHGLIDQDDKPSGCDVEAAGRT